MNKKTDAEMVAILLSANRMEELAVKLGVSYSCVRKWKYGKSKPGRLAHEKIRELCWKLDTHNDNMKRKERKEAAEIEAIDGTF